MPEKGKGEKWSVPRIDNLKGGKMKASLRAFIPQILFHVAPVTRSRYMRDTANVQITLLTEQLQWAWGRDDDPRTVVPLQDGSKTPFNRGSMKPVGAENRIRAYKELQRRITH